jgi:hypothetical protein
MSAHLKVFLLKEFAEIYLESILGTVSLLILLPLKEHYHGNMKRVSSFQNLLNPEQFSELYMVMISEQLRL